MRSENETPSICEETDVKVICAVEEAAEEYKDCPAACRKDNTKEEDNGEDEVVKSGSLAVSSSAADDRSVVVAAEWKENAVSDLDTLTFKTSEEVTISKVVLEKYGFSNADALIANVWLEDEDGNEITTKGKPNTKGLVNLTVKKDYKVVDGKLNATIVVETKSQDNVSSGSLWFKVSDVVSTAEDVDLGSYKAYKYDVVAYNGSTAKVTARGGSKDYNWEAGKTYEVSKFKLKAPDASAITLKGFTLTNKNNGTLDTHDFLDIDSVKVSVAGETVKATASINKDQELTLSLKNDVEILAKQNVEIIVSAGLNSDFDEYGKTIQFKVKSITATDKNNARITPEGADTADYLVYTFNGGKLKFTNNKLGKVEASINSTDILIADGTVTVGEAVEGSATLEINGDGFCTDSTKNNEAACKAVDGAKWLFPAEAIEEIRLVVSGDEINGTFYTADTYKKADEWKNAAKVYVKFDNIDISESGKVKLYVDIDDNADYQKKTMTFSSIVWDLKYSDSANDSTTINDKSGTISVSNLTLTEAQGSLTNSVSDDVEYNNKEVNTWTIFDWVYTAKKSDVYLNAFTVTPVYNGADTIKTAANWKANVESKITFYLSIDGDEVADKVLSCTTKDATTTCQASETFNDTLVKAGESVKIKLEAEIDAKESVIKDAVKSLELGKFNLNLAWVDENDNDAWSADKKSATVRIVSKGSTKVSTSNVKNTVLKKAADAKIAEFTVKPDGANNVTLEDVSFTLTFTPTDGDYDGDINLYVDGKNEETWNYSSTPATYSAELNNDVDSEGIVVRVELDSEFAGKVDLTELKVNWTEAKKDFSKRFETAVVNIKSQKDNDVTTTFYFGVDKKSSDSVQNVSVKLDKRGWTLVKNGEDISDGDSFWIKWDTATAEYVTAIRYTINGTVAKAAYCSDSQYNDKTACESASATWTDAVDSDKPFVTIEKSEFDDFFKLGDTDDYAIVKKQKN